MRPQHTHRMDTVFITVPGGLDAAVDKELRKRIEEQLRNKDGSYKHEPNVKLQAGGLTFMGSTNVVGQNDIELTITRVEDAKGNEVKNANTHITGMRANERRAADREALAKHHDATVGKQALAAATALASKAAKKASAKKSAKKKK